MEFKIGNKVLSESYCYVIAEAGLNHNGDLKLAKKLIDVAVNAGVDAVKFQKRNVAKLAIKSVLEADEIRNYIEFNKQEYKELKDYCEEQGMQFLCTAFDIESVDFLEKLNVEAYKLASHSLTNLPLLRYIAKLQKPTFLSTGMSTIEEIETSVNIFKEHFCPLALFHCVSSYPTPYDECNIQMMVNLKNKFPEIPIGYSGHELGYLPTIVAVSKGAQMIERHYTIDKTMIGFDHKISLQPQELIDMTQAIRDVQTITGDGSKEISETEWITRHKYHVSIVARTMIKKGTIITEDMLELKNPGTGLKAELMSEVIGKKAKENIY